MKTYGPYTPVRKAGDTYFVSGQIGIDAETQTADASIERQTHQVMQNLRACLNESGLAMDDVVKVTIYLKDIAAFATVNEIYQTYFNPPRPARACVEVSDLPHVGDVPLLVEMDAVAYKEQA